MLTVPESKRIVDSYISSLLGRQNISSTQAISLPNVAVDNHPGALATFNISIGQALDRLASSDSVTVPYGGRTFPDVIAVVKRRWGISNYPERTALSDEIGEIGHSTLRNWEAGIFNSEEFRMELEKCLRASPPWSKGDDSGWLTGLPSTYPPRSTSLERLLFLARRSGASENDHEAIQTIRQAVTTRVRAYLKLEPRHLIHHREVLEGAWFRDDIRFVEPARGLLTREEISSSKIRQSVYLRVSDSVVRLQFFLCLADETKLLRLLELTSQSRHSFAIFLRKKGEKRILSPTAHLSPIPPTNSASLIDPASPAAKAISLSNAIRMTSHSERSPLIRDYIQTRRAIQPHLTSYSEQHTRAVMQADQSVSHDAMDAMDLVGFKAVDTLRNSVASINSLSSYTMLSWRDKGLLASKRGQLDRAARITERGIQELLLLDNKQKGDSRAFLESLHQHFLSNAGTAAKVVESLLIAIPRREAHRRSQTIYNGWAAAAVRYGLRASATLTEIEDHADGHLPKVRHEDGYISSLEWPIQTKIVQLRSLLGAYTLLASTAPGHKPDKVADREMMRILYTEIASDPRLRRPRTFTFVQLALWLALIDNLTLPYVPQPSRGLAEVSFLTRSAAEMTSGTGHVLIDKERLVRAKFWFDQAPGWDRGPLTRVRRGTAVARWLSRSTDNISEIWLRDDTA